jgi:uncharacterized membrane protein required for colicin V production
MIDIVLLLILVIGFFVGFRRGIVLQVVYLTGFIISFIVAYLYFEQLAPHLKLWIPYPSLPDDSTLSLFLEAFQSESTFYRAIAFALLFFATKIIMQIIGSMLDFLADLPFVSSINGWLGGFLGLIEVYLILFFILYIGALTPVTIVQDIINDSSVAKGIVENTPVFSAKIKELWFETMT